MFEITYKGLFIFITLAWIVTRAICGIKSKKADWKYEVKLLTVYICLVVIARIVYFPMRLVEGRIASLVLDVDKIFPLWINLIPIVHLFDVYDGWLINIIGNVAMFIPVGLVWPFCFKKLDTLGKTVLVGAGFPLFIEITQLPFYDRCSDVDDLILNTTGILIGALIYYSEKRLRTVKKRVS
jgi:glycopeptide antibiotics resistance protein